MSEDQLQPDDTLDYHGVDDVLDEGFSPPDHRPPHARQIDEETLDERLAEEEPEVWAQVEAERDADILDGDVGGEVGDARTGRLLSYDDGGIAQDNWAKDEGIDGAGASAEEAAVHTIED